MNNLRIDWEQLAKERGFSSAYNMLMKYRLKNYSSRKVAALLGKISDNAVRRKMTQLGIPRLPPRPPKQTTPKRKRDFSEYVKKYNCKNERHLFYHLYWERGKTESEMGKILGCSLETVASKLKSFGIARRSRGPRSENNARISRRNITQRGR